MLRDQESAALEYKIRQYKLQEIPKRGQRDLCIRRSLLLRGCSSNISEPGLDRLTVSGGNPGKPGRVCTGPVSSKDSQQGSKLLLPRQEMACL